MCKDCAARTALLREALFQAKISESIRQAGKGIAEIVGLKEKTGQRELLEKQASESGKPNPGDAG